MQKESSKLRCIWKPPKEDIYMLVLKGMKVLSMRGIAVVRPKDKRSMRLAISTLCRIYLLKSIKLIRIRSL